VFVCLSVHSVTFSFLSHSLLCHIFVSTTPFICICSYFLHLIVHLFLFSFHIVFCLFVFCLIVSVSLFVCFCFPNHLLDFFPESSNLCFKIHCIIKLPSSSLLAIYFPLLCKLHIVTPLKLQNQTPQYTTLSPRHPSQFLPYHLPCLRFITSQNPFQTFHSPEPLPSVNIHLSNNIH